MLHQLSFLLLEYDGRNGDPRIDQRCNGIGNKYDYVLF